MSELVGAESTNVAQPSECQETLLSRAWRLAAEAEGRARAPLNSCTVIMRADCRLRLALPWP